MSASRMEKVQREIIQRYDHISNLYIAYMNSGKYSDEFGREFFHAVGEILQGKPVRQLTLFHLNADIEEIVNHSISKGGTAGPKKRRAKMQRSKGRTTRKTKNRKNKNVRRTSR